MSEPHILLEGASVPPPLLSSPLSKTPKTEYSQEGSFLTTMTPLTPPASPHLWRCHSDLEISTKLSHGRKSPGTLSLSQPRTPSAQGSVIDEDVSPIIECPFDVELAKDDHDRPQRLGQGAWSKVYWGLGRIKPGPSTSAPGSILTPPASPQTPIPLLVAVKAPLSKASQTVLENEALVLSHLMRTPSHEDSVVTFYGYLPASASLVLAPVPLPLSDHITTRCRLVTAGTADLAFTDPVLGSSSKWLGLANKLITALAWLHEAAGVVHGDIKPGNILLSPARASASYPFDPLLIDFSSSHIVSSDQSRPNTLSALTREYTAPELLSPSVLRDPSSTATTASDVFSLAVTLIVAATGNLIVYPGNVWQRQQMAQSGWHMLDFVRNGEDGLRVPQGGVVERVVEMAVKRVEQGRIDAGKWRDAVRKIGRFEATTEDG